MKPSILGFLAGSTLIAGSAMAAFEVGGGDGMPKLSISGWVDSNYVNRSSDAAGAFNDLDILSLNEVELNFGLDFGSGLTGRFDIDYNDFTANPANDNDIELEQAFFTYTFDGGESPFSVSAGRFLSWTGWESADLVNLYQFSYGYAAGIGGYQDGVRAEYAADAFSLGAGVVDSAYGGTNINNHDELAFELMGKFTGVENLTLFASYILDQTSVAGADDTQAIDLWISYQLDKLLLAAEYSTADDLGATDSDAFLFMANYSVNDWLGFTARYSMMDSELSAGGPNTFEGSEYTLAVLLKAHKNLGFIIEYRHDEEDVTNDEADTIAVEATLTF